MKYKGITVTQYLELSLSSFILTMSAVDVCMHICLNKQLDRHA